MTLEEIKAAVTTGKTVHWKNAGYTVVEDDCGRWFVVFTRNGSTVCLTKPDGVTLYDNESDFYIGEKGMLLITKTCELITEESAENGEAAQQWIDFEDAGFEFKELVRDLKDLEPSSYPITVDNAHGTWFTSYGGQNFRSAIDSWDCENYSLHYSRNNPSKNLKYWIAAIRAAGHKVRE